MLQCQTGQVIKFQYRKGHGKVSAAEYKGKIFRVIPTVSGRDIMVEMHNGLIRRFHASNIGRVRAVSMVERVLDWTRGTQHNMPIV